MCSYFAAGANVPSCSGGAAISEDQSITFMAGAAEVRPSCLSMVWSGATPFAGYW